MPQGLQSFAEDRVERLNYILYQAGWRQFPYVADEPVKASDFAKALKSWAKANQFKLTTKVGGTDVEVVSHPEVLALLTAFSVQKTPKEDNHQAVGAVRDIVFGEPTKADAARKWIAAFMPDISFM